MNYKNLGNTDLKVSTICLGTMTYGEQNTEQEGFDQMDLALDNGKHLSGIFLSLLVPHAPLIEPSVPIRTHFWSLHFFNSPTYFLLFFA